MHLVHSLSQVLLPILLFHYLILRNLLRVLNTELSFGLRLHHLDFTNFVLSLSKPTGKQENLQVDQPIKHSKTGS